MARLLRAAILIACFLYAGRTFAAGGTCPSGANYLNSSTNTVVTLASLGITNCYYVAANGSDSNTGTDESDPWLHAPMMPSCSSACLAVQNGAFGPGVGIILRGGDTWHMGNSGASPYTGGTWNFNGSPYVNGSASNPIYIGVDQTWFSGGAWARPILTGDNPASTSTNLSSCSYQIAPGNDVVSFAARMYYIFDNFELTGLCESDLNASKSDKFVNYSSIEGPMYFFNLYIHGWTHVQFGNPVSPTECTATTVCFNMYAFYGSTQSLNASVGAERIMYNVIDGSDSDPVANGVCYCGSWDSAYNYFGHATNQIVRTLHLFHDNLMEYIVDNGHANVLESVGDAQGTNAVYNNVFRHLAPTGNPNMVGIWVFPFPGSTTDVFNNMMYDVIQQIQMLDIGTAGTHQAMGQENIFNNLWQADPNTVGYVVGCSAQGYPYPTTLANNLYIVDSSTYSSGCASQKQVTFISELSMSNSKGASLGYGSFEAAPFSATSVSAPTVAKGTNVGNLNAAFCSALSVAANSDPTLSGAAAACEADTTYACTYSSTNHAVSCPAQPSVSRPLTSAWDIGPWQFNPTQVPSVIPPAGLTATVQ